MYEINWKNLNTEERIEAIFILFQSFPIRLKDDTFDKFSDKLKKYFKKSTIEKEDMKYHE